jgi:small-conductance mechanosensitive channel/CRP-like cAMP-binding protein
MQNISALFGPWIIGFYAFIFIALAALYKAEPEARKRLGGTALMAVFSIVGLLTVKLMGGGEAGRLPRLLEIASRMLAMVAAINVAAVFGFSVVMPRMRAKVSKFVEDLILAGAYALGGLAVISASGANLSGILATSAVVTGVVAFSLQDTLGNVIGGMVLHLENSFMPGDWIRVDQYEGVIREVRWRQTTLETLNGDIVVIPNINLMKSPVTVLGRAAGNTTWRAVPFNVYYDRTPGEVTAVLDAAFREDPPAGVSAVPAPYCGLKEFLPNCMAFEIRYYLTDFTSPAGVDSRVRMKIFYALSRAGIKLSVPNRSIVLSEAVEQAVEKGVKREQERRLGALKGVDVFQGLTEAERNILAGRLKPTPFAEGEMLMRQGAVADWLYIVYEGKAEVRVHSEDSDSYHTVKTLGPGDFIGEMGLFTGEPRSATVVAAADTGCYRLDKEGFSGVLKSRPEIADSIAAMLASRRVELAAARERLAGEAAAAGLGLAQKDLLSKIRNFFKL